ncbi:MAG: glutamate-5-semialdehyde dehydrogenase [Oscillospiraceae bacterium]|nr:glutamate-5-semialdehyde dehydrogenase [Oscillospiraceae bacterium]
MNCIEALGKNAKACKKAMASAKTEIKNKALSEIAESLIKETSAIITENDKDIEAAQKNNMSQAMQDRLRLTPERIKGIADSLCELIRLEDPVGAAESGTVRPNGMRVTKVRVPLGVIGIIFESRPNVTVDAAALCLKSGNCVILRGGKEAYHSNKKLCGIMCAAIERVGLPPNAVQFVDDTTREVTTELMKCREYVDVLIPRGGAGLIKAVVENAAMPVIETGVGNCHIFIDESADIEMSAQIVNNSKTRRPSVCNAAETLLVHENIAREALPEIKKKLDESRVELRGCEKTAAIVSGTKPVTEEDYYTEFLDYILAVRVVKDIGEAIAHIEKYSSSHSECIVTDSLLNADRFRAEIDSAAVYVNVSTAFTDGGMFGLGAEIGISTQKMHARGPMGLKELTSVKYLIDGSGQVRD